MKTDERRRAREMRAEGCSVKEIARTLAVSRSSASTWVRDVPLGPEQRAALIYRSRLGPIVAGELKAERARDVRRGYQEAGRQFARERGATYAAGCMLYWAEGAKERNTLKVTNSDPDLLVFFVTFLRREFDVPSDQLVLRCNLFADHIEQQHEIEDHWLERLRLPRSSLRKSAVNVYSNYSQKKRINKLPYGTAELRVLQSTRLVQTIYGSIQEYGGFERPEWLD